MIAESSVVNEQVQNRILLEQKPQDDEMFKVITRLGEQISKKFSIIFGSNNVFNIKNYSNEKIFFFQGRRFMLPSNPSIWMIIFQRDNKSVYIVKPKYKHYQKTLIGSVCFQSCCKDRKNYIYNVLKQWQGIKYIRNQEIYYGEFEYFCKNDKNALEITKRTIDGKFELSDQITDRIYQQKNLWRVFYGNYNKNVKQQIKNSIQLKYYNYQGQLVIDVLQGYYFLNLLQGKLIAKFLIDRQNNYQTKQGFYLNGYYESSSRHILQLKQEQVEYPNHLQLPIHKKSLQSLNQSQWLYPGSVYYFIRRLQFAEISRSVLTRKTNFIVQPMDELKTLTQKYKEIQNKQAYGIIWNRLQASNDYFFAFELFGIVFFPYNRQQYHFALMVVQTKTQRNSVTRQLERAKITIYDMDSMSQDQNGSKSMIKFIKIQIQKLKNKTERKIFEQALANAKIETVKTLGFKQQQNGHDCGLYVCYYSYLLYKKLVRHKDIFCEKYYFREDKLKQLRKFLKKCMITKQGNFLEKVKWIFCL